MQFVNTLNKIHFYVWSTGLHLLFNVTASPLKIAEQE